MSSDDIFVGGGILFLWGALTLMIIFGGKCANESQRIRTERKIKIVQEQIKCTQITQKPLECKELGK